METPPHRRRRPATLETPMIVKRKSLLAAVNLALAACKLGLSPARAPFALAFTVEGPTADPLAGNRITVTGAGGGTVVNVPVDVSGASGDAVFAVGGADLVDVLKRMDDDTVSLALTGDGLAVKGTAAAVTLRTLNAEPPQEYPLPKVLAFSVGRDDLVRLLAETVYAISPDDNRYSLRCLLLAREGEMLRAVSSDGARLALSEAPFSGDLKALPIGRDNAGLLLKLVKTSAPGPWTFNGDEARIRAIGGDGTAITFGRPVDEGLDYKYVIPARHRFRVRLDAKALAAALKTVGGGKKKAYTRLDFGGDVVRLKAIDGSASADVSMIVEYGNTHPDVGVDAHLLAEIVKAQADRNVILEFGGNALDPVGLRFDNRPGAMALLMPIRL